MQWPRKINDIGMAHLLAPSPKGRIPRALWLHVRERRWVLLFFLLAGLSSIIFVDLPRYGEPALIFVSILVARTIPRSARRFGVEVRENEFMNCLECGYSLRGLPEKHRCPECGVEYSLADVHSKWRDFLGDA